MATRNRYRTTGSAAKITSQSAKYAGKSVVGLARWATTDHTGTAKLLADAPYMGFINTISMIVVTLLTTLLGAVASAAMFFLLFSFGLPLLLFM